MQKSKFITITFIILIFIYILTSQFFLTRFGSVYTFIINPLYFIIFSLILKFTIISPYKTDKYKRDIIQYTLLTVLIFAIVYLLLGLFTGFGTNPYSSTIRGLFFNLYSTGIVVFCREYIRYKLINNVYDKDKNLIFVLIVIVFSIINFSIKDLFNINNFYFLFKLILYSLVPNVIKNILYTYFAKYVDYIPAFLYEIVFYIILWISPVLPNSPWILESVLNIVFPFILFLYCRYYIQKKNRFHLSNMVDQVNPTGLLPFGVFIILAIWFALGVFPIKPVGIASASMYPYLKIGDLTLIKKCNANDIETGDIIQYKMNDYSVIHRVINIDQHDGEFIFTTKGDNNKSEDKLPVREDQLLGKVIFKIPYVALPTIWIHNLNSNVQVEVETGM